jgi:hypothetical protein
MKGGTGFVPGLIEKGVEPLVKEVEEGPERRRRLVVGRESVLARVRGENAVGPVQPHPRNRHGKAGSVGRGHASDRSNVGGGKGPLLGRADADRQCGLFIGRRIEGTRGMGAKINGLEKIEGRTLLHESVGQRREGGGERRGRFGGVRHRGPRET